ncbi:TetR/AcrR family transcriptional regulator [Rhodococcus triatomae]|uniref:DNA-binding transcriptional regulator, AcrR family n=1 Tax=Rhodococcus triatomae TaxID=300028 RepID=A0A1G8B052_9NOCA|nr:TetR/AcrR family transcriptional regulator [Rhodococcus triatomae]QNG17623.1 TetR/AcrR family transcriptional regulator [Rhodococcus triatomae]QNG22710.1 TetR/AcrR family transcriptional regulator [Rhodococcus triatomae]SDH26568.1 DNA-binding transcriptional regulator, AcrR family [Rhodococcus triatomae]
MPDTDQTQTPRRQARGRRRSAEILDAAEQVFADRGFERTTTNAIAEAARISPGSLYQYFRNKEEIAAALAERYTNALTTAQEAAVGARGDDAEELDVFVTRAVDRMVAFNAEHPVFLALFMRADAPTALTTAIAPLQEALAARVHEVIATHAPGRDSADIALIALTALQIARGIMPVVARADDPLASPLTAELKRALRAYLSAAIGN